MCSRLNATLNVVEYRTGVCRCIGCPYCCNPWLGANLVYRSALHSRKGGSATCHCRQLAMVLAGFACDLINLRVRDIAHREHLSSRTIGRCAVLRYYRTADQRRALRLLSLLAKHGGYGAHFPGDGGLPVGLAQFDRPGIGPLFDFGAFSHFRHWHQPRRAKHQSNDE